MIDLGAETASVDGNGNTALMIARNCAYPDAHIIEYLEARTFATITNEQIAAVSWDTWVSVASAIPPPGTSIHLSSTNNAFRANEQLRKLWSVDLMRWKAVSQLRGNVYSKSKVRQETSLLIKFAQEMRLQDLQKTSAIKLAELAKERKTMSPDNYMSGNIFLKNWIVIFETIISESNLKKCDVSLTEVCQNTLNETKKDYIEKLKSQRDRYPKSWDFTRSNQQEAMQFASERLLGAAQFTLQPEQITKVIQMLTDAKVAAFTQYCQDNP